MTTMTEIEIFDAAGQRAEAARAARFARGGSDAEADFDACVELRRGLADMCGSNPIIKAALRAISGPGVRWFKPSRADEALGR